MNYKPAACFYESMIHASSEREPGVYRCARHIGMVILQAERTDESPRRISGVIFDSAQHSRVVESACRMIPYEQDYRNQAADQAS